MFPRLKETLGTALDLVVEFSTLGEYRLDATGVPAPASALAAAFEPTPRRGDSGPVAAGVVERIVAGGAAAPWTFRAPAATPAARRLCGGSRERAGRERSGSTPASRSRSGAPVAAQQLCFADV